VDSEIRQPLTLKYRPRRFEDMVGQRAARTLLRQMIRTNHVPAGLLLCGAWGSGKTTSARIVAAALNCEAENPEHRPCGGCTTCQAIVDCRSTDVIEIDAASSGLAEDMRELRQQVRFQPLGRYRVVILDESHELTPRGQQTLLKVLEEPPPRVIFILCTTNPDRMLDTVVSRCFIVQFQRITVKDIAARLGFIAKHEGIELSPGLAMAIADRSQGAMRDAVMLLDQCSMVNIQTVEQLTLLMGDSQVVLNLIAAMLKNDLPAAFGHVREGLETLPSPSELVSRIVSTLQRLLVLSSLPSGVESSPLSPPATEAERALAANLAPVRAVAGMRVIWEYHRSIAPTVDAFAAMNLLVVMLSQALAGAQPSARVSGSSSSRTPSPTAALSNTSSGSSAPAETVDDILARAASMQ
jgi:DNA polymerase-3 subunit gamma/tau